MRGNWLVLSAALACGDATSVVERPGEPAVVYFQGDDAQMEAAIQQARSTVQAFIAELPALQREGAYFSVKVPIVAGADTEHVWLDAPTLEDGVFHGALGNAPVDGELELGDEVRTPVAEISDWMAVSKGELFGGYTVLVARARMSEEQRREFDASVDFRVPESARSF